MIARGCSRLLLSSVLGVTVALATGCASTNVQQVAMEDVVTYKTVDDGTLDIQVNNQPWATEQYSIEAGSDGNWTASAQVKPAQEGQNARDARFELGPNMRPVSFTEEDTGPNPLKIYITFQPDKAVLMVKQGDNPEANKELPGAYDMLMTEYLLGDQRLALYDISALLARAYVEKNATGPVEFSVLGNGNKVVVKEVEPTSIEQEGQTIPLRHFVLDPAGGKLFEHVWLTTDGLKLVKVEIPRAVTATKQEFPTAKALTAVPAPAAPAQPAAPATPAEPATPPTPSK